MEDLPESIEPAAEIVPKKSGKPSEKLFIALFLALNIIVPIFIPDLYPLSSMPMYSDKTETQSQVWVYGPDNKSLSTLAFGMHQTDVCNPAPRVGRSIPQSLQRNDRLMDPVAVKIKVQERLSTLDPKRYAYVDVVQKVWTSAGEELVVVKEGRWRIRHPLK